MEKTLYIFIDEAGNLAFTPKSSKCFCMTGLVSSLDNMLITNLYHKKNELIFTLEESKKSVGHKYRMEDTIEYFHATEDYQFVRNEVISEIACYKDLKAYAVITEKSKTHPVLQQKENFYYKNVKWLMHGIMHNTNITDYDRILIFFDNMPTAKHKKAMIKGIKLTIADFFREKGIKIPYYIVSHQSKSNVYLQVVDYICWAIYVKNERGENRPYDALKHLIVNEFYPFALGRTFYY